MRYWLAIAPGEFVECPPAVAAAKAAATTAAWPHAFARFRANRGVFLCEHDSDHVHGVCGDCVEDLVRAATVFGIDHRLFA